MIITMCKTSRIHVFFLIKIDEISIKGLPTANCPLSTAHCPLFKMHYLTLKIDILNEDFSTCRLC